MSVDEYHNGLVEGVFEKIQNGSKTLVVCMPVGTGKTKAIKKLSKKLYDFYHTDILLIVKHGIVKEQTLSLIGDDSRYLNVISFKEFEEKTDDYFNRYRFIIVEELLISDRRQLTLMLKTYKGQVVSFSSIPQTLKEKLE